jgi:hypothetical protein
VPTPVKHNRIALTPELEQARIITLDEAARLVEHQQRWLEAASPRQDHQAFASARGGKARRRARDRRRFVRRPRNKPAFECRRPDR